MDSCRFDNTYTEHKQTNIHTNKHINIYIFISPGGLPTRDFDAADGIRLITGWPPWDSSEVVPARSASAANGETELVDDGGEALSFLDILLQKKKAAPKQLILVSSLCRKTHQTP